MQKIKKVFQPIISLLSMNLQATVGDLMDEINALAEAKAGGGGGGVSVSSFSADGTLIAVYCYYHKKWELVSEVEYGKKASTVTGLNIMCKEGSSRWTSQNSKSKRDTEALLPQITAGTLSIEEIPAAQEEIELAKSIIVARDDGHGYDTESEALSAANQNPSAANGHDTPVPAQTHVAH